MSEHRASDEETRLMEAIGRRIQVRRNARGLSRKALADRVGTSMQTIWQLEVGQRANISYLVLRKVAAALGVDVVRLELEAYQEMAGETPIDEEELLYTAIPA